MSEPVAKRPSLTPRRATIAALLGAGVAIAIAFWWGNTGQAAQCAPQTAAAGKIDAGETSLATAQRELVEEAGYAAERWKPLGTIHPEIGYSTEFIDLFEATGLTHVGSRLDEGEFLDIVAMTEDELLAIFDCGGFTDGKSIAALFAWRRSRGRR